ncbi:trypsin-like peptidase domain-containing protein [Thalassoglobus sp.]|uniref:trypsin-like peptidase domain-containing protein n=1 Tax=Thalassoglobus sp. TaxID=2795869 RepID=UPI003AA89758
MSKFFLFLIFLLTVPALVFASSIDQAVVLVNGCSGVCVDPAGLVMTAKHCDLPETVTIRFKERTVTAQRIYQCQETEGPVVYDCEGDGYPFLNVAASPPMLGENVWTYGYPQSKHQRELRWTAGKLLRWSTFEYGGGSFTGNVVKCRTGSGWSGGPLLNAKAEVCGLLNSGDQRTSVFISSAAVREAYAKAKDELRTKPEKEPVRADVKPTLYVFGSTTCQPCRKFKEDFGNVESFWKAIEAAFVVEFIDVDNDPELAFKENVTEVPTFLVRDSLRITGYQNPDDLLVALGLQQQVASNQVEVPPAVTEPVSQPTLPEKREPETQTSTVESPSILQATPSNDRLDRLSGLIQSAITVSTWLGVTGATGGTAGLVLGGIACWRTLRRRSQHRPGRAPPVSQPTTITVENSPLPQAIVPETRFTPYERDTYAEAFSWAESEMARKYPGSVGTLESIKGLIDQYLSAKGYKPSTKKS